MVKKILVGNPGVGKSTLLNSILGYPHFLAGVSLGSGLTREIQSVNDHLGNTLVDIPGLSDVSIAENAQNLLLNQLRSGGTFHVFFVATLEAGRIKVEDQITLGKLLAVVPELRYSLIINKVSTNLLRQINSSEIVSMFHGNFAPPQQTFFFPLDTQLLDENQSIIVSLPPDFQSFIYRSAPDFSITNQYNQVFPFPDNNHSIDALQLLVECRIQEVTRNKLAYENQQHQIYVQAQLAAQQEQARKLQEQQEAERIRQQQQHAALIQAQQQQNRRRKRKWYKF